MYKSSDGNSYSQNATILINVISVNDIPNATIDSDVFEINENTLTFWKLGYLTEEVVDIQRIKEKK